MRRLPALVVCLLLPAVGVACLWDYDTLKMERERFPDTLELITGKFLRHSPEFYRWRIADRLQRLEADPNNVRLLDDLAVAYDKVGEHDKAIATAERTERIQPGRYETAANLGTFLFHAGRLKDGLPHIDLALAINPNAHFGREKYQKLLVEYVLERRTMRSRWDIRFPVPLADCRLFDLDADDLRREPGVLYVKVENSFCEFIRPSNPDIELAETKLAKMVPVLDPETAANLLSLQVTIRQTAKEEKTAAAIKGVLGMIKFGNHRSPVLLEALGSLLGDESNGIEFDAKNLACRAFLKASYEVPEGPSRVAYRAMAKRALSMQWSVNFLKEVETEFKAELADAKQWYEAVREKELAAIREGRNPEAEFDKLYEPEPPAIAPIPPSDTSTMRFVGLALVGAGGVLILGWFAIARRRAA